MPVSLKNFFKVKKNVISIFGSTFCWWNVAENGVIRSKIVVFHRVKMTYIRLQRLNADNWPRKDSYNVYVRPITLQDTPERPVDKI